MEIHELQQLLSEMSLQEKIGQMDATFFSPSVFIEKV